MSYNIKSLLFLVLFMALSACDRPNRDIRISTLRDGSYSITGAFKNHFAIPASVKPNNGLVVQNGRIRQSFSEVDPSTAKCLLVVKKFEVSYPEILNAYNIKELPLTHTDSFFKQRIPARVSLIKTSGQTYIEISDSVDIRPLASNAPYNMNFLVKLNATLSCTRANQSESNPDMTVGELMDIFQLKYIWKAPSL